MARRTNGDGTLRKRSDGSYEYRICVGIGFDGKAIRKSFYASGPQKAKQKYKDWLKSGEEPIEKVSTVGTWAKKWLEIYKKDKVSYGTYYEYKIIVDKNIIPHIGSLKFSQLRPAHIENFMRLMAEEPYTYSWSRRKKILAVVKAIISTASNNYLCPGRTNDDISRISIETPMQKEAEFFTREELANIFSYSHKYDYLIKLLLFTGLRRGELLALTWNRVDLKNRVLFVERTLSLTEEGYAIQDKTKGKRSRPVPIDSELREVLKGLPRDGIYVLSNKGKPWTRNMFLHRYNTFFRELNATLEPDNQVRLLSPHKCRHSFATYLVLGGANVRAAQEILGHTEISMTMRYSHTDTAALTKTIKKLTFK